MHKIYTRAGDLGTTRLLGGETVEKGDLRVKAYGALDELQSHIGFVRALTCREKVQSVLQQIQQDISLAGSELASTPRTLKRLKRRLDPGDVTRLETWIDEFAEQFGPPRCFIIPGKYLDSSALHVARAVCRRCERIISVLNKQEGLYAALLSYFNRLSDLLFVMAWYLGIRSLVKKIVEKVRGEMIPERKMQ